MKYLIFIGIIIYFLQIQCHLKDDDIYYQKMYYKIKRYHSSNNNISYYLPYKNSIKYKITKDTKELRIGLLLNKDEKDLIKYTLGIVYSAIDSINKNNNILQGRKLIIIPIIYENNLLTYYNNIENTKNYEIISYISVVSDNNNADLEKISLSSTGLPLLAINFLNNMNSKIESVFYLTPNSYGIIEAMVQFCKSMNWNLVSVIGFHNTPNSRNFLHHLENSGICIKCNLYCWKNIENIDNYIRCLKKNEIEVVLLFCNMDLFINVKKRISEKWPDNKLFYVTSATFLNIVYKKNYKGIIDKTVSILPRFNINFFKKTIINNYNINLNDDEIIYVWPCLIRLNDKGLDKFNDIVLKNIKNTDIDIKTCNSINDKFSEILNTKEYQIDHESIKNRNEISTMYKYNFLNELPYIYDGIYFLANAIDNLFKKLSDDLDSSNYYINSTKLKDEMNYITINGITGKLKFYNGIRAGGLLSYNQIIESNDKINVKIVGSFEDLNAYVDKDKISYPTGTIPIGRLSVYKNDFSSLSFNIIFIINIFIIISILIYLTIFVLYKNHIIVIRSSLPFLIIFHIGLLFIAFSTVLSPLSYTDTGYILLEILKHIGYLLVLTTLFEKVYRYFTTTLYMKQSTPSIEYKTLFLPLLKVITIFIIIPLVICLFYGMPNLAIKQISITKRGLYITTIYNDIYNLYMKIAVTLIYIYIIIIASISSFVISRINTPANESLYISISLWTIVFLMFILLLLKTKITVPLFLFILQSIIDTSLIGFISVFICLPKIMSIFEFTSTSQGDVAFKGSSLLTENTDLDLILGKHKQSRIIYNPRYDPIPKKYLSKASHLD